ncbi:hypothetical protein MYAM1_002506 [Malassezia yamatoensis]|uniref:Condensin complex subunit 2 n=1 Tax=Malassezia yamatoensis TaxID=253288 RepID=A0AAJ6CJD5_9BASI|nr:hypothetical protein MYAM1_002506 [Malassezia yamatoensis]
MLPFRAPSGSTSARNGVTQDAAQSKRVNSGAGRRILSQNLARTQQRVADMNTSSVSALKVDNTSFEEWMKMATDNKINSTNTWSFALIDYFHDMSLLRSESGDGSINFQKASCTLDGCIKVWTSRVDSVMVETGRLLSGLQDQNESLAESDAHRVDADESQEEDHSDENRDHPARTARRTRRNRQATLVKDFAQLQVKRFDLEFSVDPLFKKTSADFDEGGAGGLLMNHLHVDDSMKVVFDSTDFVKTKSSSDSANDDLGNTNEATSAEAIQDETSMDMDPPRSSDQRAESSLGSTHFDTLRDLLLDAADANLTGIAKEDQVDAVLKSRVLCPSLATFAFTSGNDAQLPLLDTMEEDLDSNSDAPSLDRFADTDDQQDAQPELDFFQEGDAELGNDDFGATLAHSTDENTMAQPSQGEHDLLFDYFDNRMKKNWAGPEHWKLSRLAQSSHLQRDRRAQSMAPSEPEQPRRRKEPPTIDFLTPEQERNVQKLFAPSTTPASIAMPRALRQDTSTHLLPEDQHFNSKKLLRLFLKPKATILLQSRPDLLRTRGSVREDAPWATLDAPNGEQDTFAADLFHEDDMYDDVLPPADLDVAGQDLDESDDETLALDTLRRVRPEFVEHAKRAKQVDIKQLKDNLWDQLQNQLNPSTPTVFHQVLDKLSSLYPKSKLQEISTSFCFICLLHLANEQNLALSIPNVISTSESDDQLGAPETCAEDHQDIPQNSPSHLGYLDQLQILQMIDNVS